MRFLCLCHYDASAFAAMSPDAFKAVRDICAPHDDAFKTSGHVEQVGSLAMPEDARTLRADAAGVTVDAGPYAPTTEPFGAFFIIEADTIDDAERIARLHPATHLGARMTGGIEIRPIRMVEYPGVAA